MVAVLPAWDLTGEALINRDPSAPTGVVCADQHCQNADPAADEQAVMPRGRRSQTAGLKHLCVGTHLQNPQNGQCQSQALDPRRGLYPRPVPGCRV